MRPNLALLQGALSLATSLALFAGTASAQERSRHADTWTFGNGCRMKWNADASAITLSVDPRMATGEGCASFSDPETGDLLLYTDGRTVWNGAATQVYAGLPGDPSSLHSGVIVPVPGSPGTVYVFAHGATASSTVQYARFDLANGSAFITGSAGSVNVGSGLGREGMLVIPHANGVDYWLLVSGATNINVIKITSSGVGTPTSVDSGLSVWSNGWHIFTMSHQNDLLAMSSNSGGDIALWDFDNRTGALSNRRVINNPRPAGVANREYYGGVFSPDGSKLYFSVLTADNGVGYFYQYDLDTKVYTQLDQGPDRYYHGDGRLGPDGKIYVAGSQAAGVHVIDNPNLAGTACGFRRNAIPESSPGWAGGCAVALGLPQSPSPLVKVNLELAITINVPGDSVTTDTLTPSGSANAPNGSTVLVTVTGPSGTSTCTATVQDAAWTCATDAITGLTPGSYAVTAVVTFEGEAGQDDAAFCRHGVDQDPNSVCFETCDNLVDDDNNGYIDVFDQACQPQPVDCSVPVTPAAFTVKLARQTQAAYEDLFWPVSGDVDNDGETEVLAARANPDRIEVLDGKTLAVESTIPVDGDRGDVFVLANLDADPELEVVTLIHQRLGTASVNRMIIADFSGGAWKVNISAADTTVFSCNGNVGSGLGLGVADFDADGKAEIFYGNEVWTYADDLSTGCTGCITKRLDADRDADMNARHGCATYASGAGAQGPISVAADVLSVADCGGDAECEGPELIVANQVFSVDLATPKITLRRDVNTFSGAGTGYLDGFAAVADLDSDGDLDVAVHGTAPNGNLYVYDPANSKVVKIWNINAIGGHGYSPLTIADVFDEDLADDGNTTNGSVTNVPEIVFTRQFLLAAVNTRNNAPIWQLTTADHSGSTSSAVFDFNGDGVLEIAYRDSSNVRVMYGGPLAQRPTGVGDDRNYAAFACTSATMNEGPMIADIDDNGAAELAVVCGSDGVATLSVFESASTPWREARRVWNQPIFVPGAIDEDGNVYPVEQARNSYIPDTSLARPLNAALAQISPLDLRPAERNRIPAIDAELVAVALTSPDTCEGGGSYLDVTLRNAGAVAITDAMSFTIHVGDGQTNGPTEVLTLGDATTVWAGSLPIMPGETTSLRFAVGSIGATELWVDLNAGGAALPECDPEDNASDAVACVVEGCSDLGTVPALGCDEEAPYCATVFGVRACVPCIDDTAAGTDTGCSSEAPSCDPITRTCGSCEGDPACAPQGLCASPGTTSPYEFPIDPTCEVAPQVGLIDPAVEWQKGAFTTFTSYNQVMMQPVVGNLTDDNGDQKIDALDVPDVVFTTFTGGAYGSAGVLRVLSGLGEEVFATDGSADGAPPWSSSGVALGDLDGNGRPEIVVGLSTAASASVGVWEANVPGQSPAFVFKWKSNACGGGSDQYPHPAIANVDGLGGAEVIMPGPCVLSSTGELVGVPATAVFGGNMPFAADMDADPELEIIGSGTVYDLPTSGTTLVPKYSATASANRVFSAVGDVDGDGRPELVSISYSDATAIMYDPDGAADADNNDGWSVVIDTTGSGARGGAPTLADFDGDGAIEVGVAAMNTYSVLESNGSLLWSKPVFDNSSRYTGSAVFDFDGDGSAEVVYADQETLFIYDGKTGNIRYRNDNHASGTLFEYPIVVDVDRDGQAEIVLASNNYTFAGWTGITVLGSDTDSWAPARPVWNQHAYSISNVNDDLSIPAVPVKNWERWNNFRAGAPIEGLANWRSDLFVAARTFCEGGCDEAGAYGAITVHVGNRGKLDVSLAEVRLYAGTLESSPFAVGTVEAIASGGAAAGTVFVNAVDWGVDNVIVEVVSMDELPECNLTNNFADLAFPPVYTDADADDIADVCDSCIATGAEICDGVDNDCNGSTDEGCDDDGDDYCDANMACGPGSEEVCPKGCGDCNDSASSANPAGAEVCDGLDNDCKGGVDNDIAPVVSTCGVGGCARTGLITCQQGKLVDSCSPGAPAANDAVCNGIDDDCAGGTDEDYAPRTITCQQSQCQVGGVTSCVGGKENVPVCTPVPNGRACNLNVCALAAECQAGVCTATRIRTCDDGNSCTVDSCDPSVGCVADNAPNGSECTDNNACTTGDTCAEGVCGGQGITCGPPGECEGPGVCNPATGVCDYSFQEGCLLCQDDKEPPVLTCPQAVKAQECTLGGTRVQLGEASARDTCSNVTITSDAPVTFPAGTTVVTFTAVDAAGNRSVCSTSVEVADETPPVVNCPEVTTVQGDPGTCGAVVTVPVTGSDDCDGTDLTFLGPVEAFFPPGPTDVLITAVDAAGNQTVCETVVDVTGLDGFAIACEPELEVEAPADFCGFPEALVATVQDECNGLVEVESDISGFPIGVSEVVFDAERSADGKTATCTTVLTVVDRTKPAIDCGAPSQKVELVASFSPQASDACGVELEVTQAGCVRVTGEERVALTERCDVTVEDGVLVVVNDAPPSNGGIVYVTYTVTATDPSGNSSTRECLAPVDPESLDHDGDTVIDRWDNCVLTPNMDQLDTDLDGIGDACDENAIEGIFARGDGGCSGGAAGLGALAALLGLLGLGALRRRA